MPIPLRTWRVKSATSKKGATYVVSEYDNGTWGCGCPAWTMNKNRPDCKHILQIKVAILSRDQAVLDALSEYKQTGYVSEKTKEAYKNSGGDGYSANKKEIRFGENIQNASQRPKRRIVI